MSSAGAGICKPNKEHDVRDGVPGTHHHPVKPTLRGVSHLYAAFAAAITGIVLLLTAPTKRGALASLAFSASLIVQFTVSSTYHTLHWGPLARQWWRRADHAAIFVLIAGTYTPICLLALRDSIGKKLLIAVWTGAGVGVAQSLFWVRAPKALATLLYLVLGWLGARYAKEVLAATSWNWGMLIIGGGVLYSVGAFAYMLKWPDPIPGTFGYHEVFHAFVIMAAIVHYVAVFQLVYWQEAAAKVG